MLKLRVKPRILEICVIISILAIIPIRTAHAQTAPTSFPEPYTELYVIYNHPEVKTFSVELRNQKRNLDGSVTANIAVRSDDLIAYNLTFDEVSSSGGYWEDVDFLPLYPGHVYEIATIRIERGGYFKIQGTKFGLSENVLPRMTVVQMCILVMHLVGAKPPIEAYEVGQAAAESFDKVPGISGVISNIALSGYGFFGREREPVQAMLDLGDAVSESDKGANAIADVVNLITKGNGDRVTGSSVQTFFKVINIFEIISDAARAIKAFRQLQNGPDLLEATITLAPEIVSQADRYRVFEINETFNTEFSYKNLSSEAWTPDQGYELWVMLESLPLQRIPLATIIPRNNEANWDLQQIAPAIPGIHHFQYQMAIKGVPIGLPVKAEIVVVPEKSDNLQDLIQAMIDEAKQKAGERFDEFVADLERRILEAIANEISRRLQEICGGTGVLLLGGLLVAKRQLSWARNRTPNDRCE